MSIDFEKLTIKWEELNSLGDVKISFPVKGERGYSGNYNELENKPRINNIQLIGNKTLSDLNIASASDLSDVNSQADSNTSRIFDLESAESNLESTVTNIDGRVTSNTNRITIAENRISQIPRPTDAQVKNAVNSWLDTHPEATTTVEDGAISFPKLADDVASLAIVESASGEIASFNDGADGVAMKELNVAIEPVQNLNGYSHPWSGGSGKNKLPFFTSGSLNGVTFTVASNGSVKASGTASSTVNYAFIFTVAETGSYTLSGCPSGGGASSYQLWIYDNNTSTSVGMDDTGSGKTGTLDSTHTYSMRIRYANGYTANQTFYPMLRLATEADATYEPYENICPISGWDSVDVNVRGKNLNIFPYHEPSKTANGITWTVNSDGTVTANGTATATSLFIFHFRGTGDLLLKQGEYIISGCPSGGSSSTYRITSNRLVDGVGVNYPGADVGSGYTINVTEDTVIGVFASVATGATVNNLVFRPMIRLASDTDATFEPYNGNTTTVDLGQTVYGGSLNVTTGVLTVDRAMVDLGTLTWTRNTSDYSYAYFYSNGLLRYSQIPLVCSHYPFVYGGKASLTTDKSIAYYSATSTRMTIRDDSYTDATSFKTAMSGAQCVYSLLNPQIYQLTPTQVNTLLGGQNNVWADSGSVDVIYRADTKTYIDNKFTELTNAIISLGGNV